MNPPYEECFDSSISIQQQNWTQDITKSIPTCKGVLLFVDSNHRPIQLLQTANLRRTARIKLLNQDEFVSKITDISKLTEKIFWRCCFNDFMTQTVYMQLACSFFTNRADEWINLPHPCFSVIETDSYLPRFDVSNNPAMSKKRIVFGLFPNRKTAAKFSKTLNSIFCLCQNPKLLKTGRESGCPYFQMQKCTGPCIDPTRKSDYLNRVHRSLATANGHVESAINTRFQQMNDAANVMNFEKANELKKQIEQLKKLQRPDCQWVHNLQNLCALHVDRTFKKSVQGQRKQIQQYQCFKIDSKAIYDLGFLCPTSQQDIARFLEHNWTDGVKIPLAGDIKKHLANLTFFIFRTKSSGIWVDCTEGILPTQLYPEIDRLLGKELPEYSEKNKDAE